MLNDDRLRDALEREGGGAEPEPASESLLRRFERGRKKLLLYSAFWHWVGLLTLVWGMRLVAISEDTPSLFRGLVLFLSGVAILIVIKLWWWIADNRIVLMQGVKELQMQVAALEERLEARTEEKGGRDA